MSKARILIIDDEAAQRGILRGFLEQKQYKVLEAASGLKGIEAVAANHVDIVLTDFKMPDITGQEVLERVKSINPEISVVIVTAFGTVESAVSAMKKGAFDYITKPVDLDELELTIERISERMHLLRENTLLREQLADVRGFSEIIGQSPKMREILSIVQRVAPSSAAVLITGESGTGKELIAKAIHAASERNQNAFVAVNCAALNENLLESELFGHEKGAFTGADKQRTGRFEAATGGTIFLDEIGDIPTALQVKLLRVLQEGNFERVGSSRTLEADVRVIAATNRNLKDLTAQGEFREDLYYRLNVVSIEIPPLRERKDDLPELIEFILKKVSGEYNKPRQGFSSEAMDTLLKYDYPGNVRELENIIRRAVVLSRGEIIRADELAIELFEGSLRFEPDTGLNLEAAIESLEIRLINKALNSAGGNQTKAAVLLGISESNLRYRLNRLGLKKN